MQSILHGNKASQNEIENHLYSTLSCFAKYRFSLCSLTQLNSAHGSGGRIDRQKNCLLCFVYSIHIPVAITFKYFFAVLSQESYMACKRLVVIWIFCTVYFGSFEA